MEKIGKENDLILQSEILKLRTKYFKHKKASPEEVNKVMFQDAPLEVEDLESIG